MEPELCECGNKGHKNLRACVVPLSEIDSEDCNPVEYDSEDFEGDSEEFSPVEDDSEDFDPIEDHELNLEEIEQEINWLVPLTITSQGYCNSCQGFIEEWPELSGRLLTTSNDTEFIPRKHYETPFDLEAGERSGCRLCVLFVRGIRMGDGLEYFYKLTSRLKCLGRRSAIDVCIDRNPRGSLTIKLEIHGEGYRRPLEGGLHTVQGDVSEQIGVELGQGFAAPTRLDLAKRWLETCTNSHDACKGVKNYRMPTRLLAVGEDVVRLVTTTDWDSAFRPQYATLSHCWGGIDFLKLTSTALERFTKEVPLKQLTKTFRDTIAIARGLRIPYLWIDSLCIVQDSTEDWEAEAGLMSSVYGNSMVTIAATGAVNGNLGLHLQPEGYVGKVHIDVPTDNGAQGWDIASDVYRESVSYSALAKRAWALQERLLSPRILHFTDTELFWECRSLLACESFPEGVPEPLISSYDTWHNSLSISDEWKTVIRLYTQANLTFERDKLVAISGIARVAQEDNNDGYLAGMWRHELEAQLCWNLSLVGKRPSRTEKYRAPSWSWASVDGQIIPYEYFREPGCYREEYFAHVLDASVIPLGSESGIFGRLRGGTVKISSSSMLSGKLLNHPKGIRRSLEVISATPFSMRVQLDLEDEGDGQTLYVLPLIAKINTDKSEHSQSENDQFEGDQSENEPFEGDQSVDGQRKEDDGSLSIGTSNGGVVAEEPRGDVPLNRKDAQYDEISRLDDKSKAAEDEKDENGEGTSSLRLITGLILRPSGAKKGEFSRAGMFYVHGLVRRYGVVIRDFLRGLNTDGAGTAESCCAEIIATPKHPGEKYLITII